MDPHLAAAAAAATEAAPAAWQQYCPAVEQLLESLRRAGVVVWVSHAPRRSYWRSWDGPGELEKRIGSRPTENIYDTYHGYQLHEPITHAQICLMYDTLGSGLSKKGFECRAVYSISTTT
jgi:hypothetical protein